MKDIADIIARIFLALIFLYEAIDSLLFYENTKDTMTNYGITHAQDFYLITVISLLILGSILVLIGYHANFGAILLLLYWLPFTLIVYSFWDDDLAIQRINALYFMRNMGVCSGLLLLVANGAGKYSIKRLIHVMRPPKE